MREKASVFLMGALVVLSVGAVWAGVQVSMLDGKLGSILFCKGLERDMQTLTQTVDRPDGSSTVVVTTRQDGESVADFVARHDATIAWLKEH